MSKQNLIFTAGPKSQFFEQIWIRDTCLSIINIMAKKYPIEAYNTLNLIFEFQKKDGLFPIRIEGNRHWMKYIPILRNLKFLINRKYPRPIYTNRLNSPFPRDDIPMVILASQEIFHLLSQDEKQMEIRWQQMVKAIEKEESFQKDGLVYGTRFQDWVDSIHRKGKLSNINILFYRALEAMSSMAKQMGKTEESQKYADKMKDYKEKIIDLFWHEDGYFKAGSRDFRFDSFSNILATLFLINPQQAVKIQNNIVIKNVMQNGLLKNFDRSYPQDIISKIVKLGKMEDYHNHYSWPWVTCMNIIAKLKIAADHPDDKMKKRFKSEALEDFIRISDIFNQDQGIYEILDDETELPVEKNYNLWLFKLSSYKSSPDFLIATTVYLQAMEKLSELGLIQVHKDTIKISSF